MRIKLNDREIKTLLNNLVILVDRNEKENTHITEWLKKHHHKAKKFKLDEGDYSAMIPRNDETKDILMSLGVFRDLYFTDEILIERKRNLDELAGNLKTGQLAKNQDGLIMVYVREEDLENKNIIWLDGGGERERFKFELTRIRNVNARLFLFIEDEHGDKNLRFGVYRSKYEPKAFLGSLKSFEAEFDFAYKFYSPDVMGSEVYQTIYYQVRDILKKGDYTVFKDMEDEKYA